MKEQHWENIERWWKAYKHKMIQFIGSLIMERDEASGRYVASLGRISFWAVLAPALHIWITGRGMLEAGEAVRDISPNHMTLILSLLGYNMSKKVVDGVNKTVVIMKGGKPSAPPEPQDGPG